ncbi:MAG TPA: STM4015 family protein [Gemmataceae bacterium]|jgi:hypothetical protein
MTNAYHVDTFAGRKVADYHPDDGGIKPAVAYRLGLEYGSEFTFPELLDRFLGEVGSADVTALVVGPWDYDTMVSEPNREVIEALVAARDRLPKLRSLFLGDIIGEECEISWINQGDVSPLLAAYPGLEEFRVRGAVGLTFGRLRHANLRSLAVESGGLPAEVLAEIFAADLPRLEHLELLLGTEDYGGINDVAPLQPLLAGTPFPKLRYLGLCNSRIADEVAKAVAASPLLNRVRVLDLSLGNLSDDGAAALRDSPAVRRLEKLDIHHHFVSPTLVGQLQALGIPVDASDVQEPYDFEDGIPQRYNAMSE